MFHVRVDAIRRWAAAGTPLTGEQVANLCATELKENAGGGYREDPDPLAFFLTRLSEPRSLFFCSDWHYGRRDSGCSRLAYPPARGVPLESSSVRSCGLRLGTH